MIDSIGRGGMPSPPQPEITPVETRWIFARLAPYCGEVNRALADYRFDEAANAVYQFFWGDLCDWYLELVKLRLDFGPPKARSHQPRDSLSLAPGRRLRSIPPPALALHALPHRRDLARALRRQAAGKVHRSHALSRRPATTPPTTPP